MKINIEKPVFQEKNNKIRIETKSLKSLSRCNLF